jgi:hypothetical protein|tara:strand:+ start:352 stop:573 length:222 start_codon:yes stop_codon:yes gene_type:complete
LIKKKTKDKINNYIIKAMTTTEILGAIKEQVEVLELENSKSSKAARGRARRAANEIKKLSAEFKKTSLAEDKA